MGIMGLQAIYKDQTPAKKLPTASHLPLPATEVYQSRARTTFGGDITYIPVRRGFLYLVAIMDWATRKGAGVAVVRTRWMPASVLKP
jgi:putative transposase